MRRPVRPECPAGCPVRSQPFVVRHSVLDDESLNSLRVCQGHAKANRLTVVLHIKRVAREPERFAEVIHDLSVVIEGIREFFRVRSITVPEAGVIGRNKVITIAKPGEERLEHP